MKTIVVRKTLGYDPTMKGKYSRYEGYCLITRGELDPHIVPGQKKIEVGGYREICCSCAKRAGESVGGKYTVRADLNEVKFNLEKMVSKSEFKICGSNVVRKRFLEYFEADRLDESLADIKLRIDRMLNRLKKKPEGQYLLVSHSFLMKILEAYVRNKNIFLRPEEMRYYLNSTQRTYNFGEGFDFEL